MSQKRKKQITKTKATEEAVRYVQIGTASVDSGMLMIVDPCYVLRYKRGEEMGLEKGLDQSETRYERAMELCYDGSERFRKVGETEDGKILVKPAGVFNPLDEMTNEKHREIAYGAVCSTVLGDGEYPVYAVYEGEALVGMEVRFQ